MGSFCPRGHLAMSRDFLVVTTEDMGWQWMLLASSGWSDAVKHPTVYRTALDSRG